MDDNAVHEYLWDTAERLDEAAERTSTHRGHTILKASARALRKGAIALLKAHEDNAPKDD